MSLLSRIKGRGPSGFGFASTAEEVTRGLDLSSRTILLTGCNSGLGLETLRVLGLRGARVIGTARTAAKAEAACAQFAGQTLPLACDLADPGSVRACIDNLKTQGVRLDAIICNAGIMALPEPNRAHGYELQFFTNHIGHFLLVTSLLGQLSDLGRVVMVSSEAHRRTPPKGIELDNLAADRGYSPWRAYGQSKLANLLFARELSRRLPRSGQLANALHPGVIATNLTRNMPGWARAGFNALGPLGLKSIPQGAATQCYLATHPQATANGEYWKDSNVALSSRLGRDLELAKRLWEASERIVQGL
jgi:NAD(P)-dependent dehydrogenase (short-subunit alcohol dehydrogenase family)